MKLIKGNILDIERGIIIHQTNIFGVAGGGLAFQIRNKYPLWYEDYHDYCQTNPKIGNVQFWRGNQDFYIVNLFGQKTLGGHATIEDSYDLALPEIQERSESLELPVYFPYMIGCGLGGGNYDVIMRKIEKYTPEATIVQYEN